MLAAYLVPGVEVTLVGALVAAVVIGLINMIIRPIIILVTLPVNVITLGLFSLVINALLIILAAKIVPGFEVVGFLSAFIFAIVLSIINVFFVSKE